MTVMSFYGHFIIYHTPELMTESCFAGASQVSGALVVIDSPRGIVK